MNEIQSNFLGNSLFKTILQPTCPSRNTNYGKVQILVCQVHNISSLFFQIFHTCTLHPVPPNLNTIHQHFFEYYLKIFYKIFCTHTLYTTVVHLTSCKQHQQYVGEILTMFYEIFFTGTLKTPHPTSHTSNIICTSPQLSPLLIW